MNLPIETPSQGDIGNAGAVVLGGTGAASAQTFTVGAVGFGPTWSDYEEGLREMYDAACRTIVRMECEADELRAEAALAEAERIEMAKVLRSERQMHAQCQNERDELRAANAVAEQERRILVRELERLREMVADERARDAACAEKCRDKAAADGGWANI